MKRIPFKFLGLALATLLMGGCASVRKTSRFDDFEKVKVDRLAGNSVSGAVFQKTILCLNALRETRRLTLQTNQSVVWLTNKVVSAVTNTVLTAVTNLQIATATNQLVGASPTLTSAPPSEPTETNQTIVAVTNVPSGSVNTGQTSSTTGNQSIASGPNQAVTTGGQQSIVTLNLQGTLTTGNVTISSATNRTVTLETNYTITSVTNAVVTAVTNTEWLRLNRPVHDYYLYTELTPPPDFTLQPGESLVLLVDGQRYALTQSSPQAPFVPRRGFTTTFYKVSPEVLVAIANAHEVRLRLKGVNHVVERTMNSRSRQHIKDFLVKYFVPETDSDEAPPTASAPTGALPAEG